jgi:hypothetical protein
LLKKIAQNVAISSKKIMHHFALEKVAHKYWATFVILKNYFTKKTIGHRREFAQSGHPGRRYNWLAS